MRRYLATASRQATTVVRECRPYCFPFAPAGQPYTIDSGATNPTSTASAPARPRRRPRYAAPPSPVDRWDASTHRSAYACPLTNWQVGRDHQPSPRSAVLRCIPPPSHTCAQRPYVQLIRQVISRLGARFGLRDCLTCGPTCARTRHSGTPALPATGHRPARHARAEPRRRLTSAISTTFRTVDHSGTIRSTTAASLSLLVTPIRPLLPIQATPWSAFSSLTVVSRL